MHHLQHYGICCCSPLAVVQVVSVFRSLKIEGTHVVQTYRGWSYVLSAVKLSHGIFSGLALPWPPRNHASIFVFSGRIWYWYVRGPMQITVCIWLSENFTHNTTTRVWFLTENAPENHLSAGLYLDLVGSSQRSSRLPSWICVGNPQGREGRKRRGRRGGGMDKFAHQHFSPLAALLFFQYGLFPLQYVHRNSRMSDSS